MPNHASSPSLIIVSVLGSIVALQAAEPAATDDDFLERRLEARDYQCVDLTRTESGYFVVAATLAGKDVSLIVDTGAPCAHLDVARLRTAGISWPTSIGRTKAEVGNLLAYFNSLRIGRVSIGGLLAVPDDLSASNERLKADEEPPVDGFLGADILRAHAAVVDLASNRLFLRSTRISADAPVDRELHEALGRALVARKYDRAELELHARMYLAVAGGIDRRNLQLMVDTGAPATYLDRSRTADLELKWAELERPATLEAPPLRYASVGRLQVRSIALGPLTVWSTDSLTKVNEAIASLGGDPFDGLLGTDVLIARAAVIDYPTRRLYLRPPKK